MTAALTALLLTLLTLSLPAPAAACSCPRRSLCELFSPGSNAILFEATVASIEATELPPVVGQDTPAEWRRVRAVHLKDIKNLLGDGEALVVSPPEGSSCSIPFTVGRRYVIHAWRGMGFLTTGGCSKTRPVEQAGPLLDYLASLSRPSPGATVSGSVRGEVDTQLATSRAALKPHGVTVHLDGPVSRSVAVADEDGAFAFDRLPPGRYALDVSSAEPWLPRGRSRDEFTLASAHACYTTSFDLTLDAEITGTVIDAGGRPVEGAALYLRRASAVAEARQSATSQFVYYDRTISDALGRYVFAGVPPGEFIVGLNLMTDATDESPYKPVFVTAADGQPEVVVLPLGGHRLLTPVVAERASFVAVRGRVVWPDGRPAAAIAINAAAHGELREVISVGAGTLSDEDGRFTLLLPSGSGQTLFAVAPGRVIRGQIDIVAGVGDVTIVLPRQ